MKLVKLLQIKEEGHWMSRTLYKNGRNIRAGLGKEKLEYFERLMANEHLKAKESYA